MAQSLWDAVVYDIKTVKYGAQLFLDIYPRIKQSKGLPSAHDIWEHWKQGQCHELERK